MTDQVLSGIHHPGGMCGSFSGRIFSYSARKRLPLDVTDIEGAGDNVESVFGYWHGPMCCDACEIVISAILPLTSCEEMIDVDVWWKTARENLFPRTLDDELCPCCKNPTLHYHHIDEWYAEYPRTLPPAA